jgi:hypothetical protein
MEPGLSEVLVGNAESSSKTIPSLFAGYLEDRRARIHNFTDNKKSTQACVDFLYIKKV